MTFATELAHQPMAALPLFRGVPAPTVERLLARRRLVSYDAGEIIVQEGDQASTVFIVIDGAAKITKGRQAETELLIDIVGSGDAIAEYSFHPDQLYDFSAEAVTNCRLVAIELETLAAILREDTSIASVLFRIQHRHLKVLMDQVEQMKLLNAAQRVGAYLLRLTRDQQHASVVTLPYEKALIAGLLGMNPESFSRALSKLRDIGITVKGRNFHISSISKLRRLVQSV